MQQKHWRRKVSPILENVLIAAAAILALAVLRHLNILRRRRNRRIEREKHEQWLKTMARMEPEAPPGIYRMGFAMDGITPIFTNGAHIRLAGVIKPQGDRFGDEAFRILESLKGRRILVLPAWREQRMDHAHMYDVETGRSIAHMMLDRKAVRIDPKNPDLPPGLLTVAQRASCAA